MFRHSMTDAARRWTGRGHSERGWLRFGKVSAGIFSKRPETRNIPHRASEGRIRLPEGSAKGRNVRKLIVVLAAVIVTAGGAALAVPPAAASAASSAAASSSARITWGKCSDPDLKKANAQCGFLKVPLDYRHPH